MSQNKLQLRDFVHLHNHTQYSLLDGLTKIPALLDFVQKAGMEAVAVTDHGTLSGLIELYKEATARKIKPIFGMEAYVAARAHTDRDPSKDKVNFHLTLLAIDKEGYQNLMMLSTKANLDGFYYRPRVDHELLRQHNKGLIVLSGCIGGEVGDALRQGQYDQAKKIAAWYKDVFGDRYYLEIQDHGHPKHPHNWSEQIQVTEQTFRLAEELAIPCVVTCDAHYLQHEDKEAHEVLLCVQTGSFLTDSKRMSLKEFDLHITAPEEVIDRWGRDHPEVITNTRMIADRCHTEIDLGNILIPKFPVPNKQTEKSHLHTLVYQGLSWRYGGCDESTAKKLTIADAKKTLPKDVTKRARYELATIDSMGFNGYFLIIADFINWGKNNGIVFGPGRGSAAGSIIAYALKITELDPLVYGLLFERFLNPERISMPDIDIDIQDTRRDEVIRYCIDKYGHDRVANIVTFGRMAARNAVRDVARVLQVPYAEADRLAKLIPPPIQGRHIPLRKILADNASIKYEYEQDEQIKRVFDLATQLEGTIRSHGVHAAGVVIAPGKITDFVPLEKAQKGVVTTQYSMGPIEDLGLLKMDFLGLSNLTIIKNTLRIIKKVHNKDIDINTIPLDDKSTFALFQRGDTTGVFQFESSGMKRYLKELKPTVFEDLIAMTALYRPGPMQWIEDFIARKQGKRAISYVHPSMEPALKDTYGVIVYQEQVMQISKEMCGFSGGQADTLRKAIGKKIPEVMRKLKDDFIDGAVKHSNADRALMEKFWKQLEDFAAYCFNKSHAACYALIAYQTAYLKAHYPAAFMSALMTSDFDDTDRLAIEVAECKHLGLTVLPPDINESFVEFAVVPKTKQIRFGLAAIKNVGSAAVEEILNARQNNRFTTIEDFLAAVSPRLVNRKTLECLIKAGAFDSFGRRDYLLNGLDTMLAYSSRLQKQLASGQTDLFGGSESEAARPRIVLSEDYTPIDMRQQLQWERELLGLYLSQDPLSVFKNILAEQTVPINILREEHDNKRVSVGGAVVDVREILTKNGQKMAFVKIVDQFAEIELILFPSVLQQTLGVWERDRVVLASGKVTARDRNGKTTGEIKILVNDAREITTTQAEAYQLTGKTVRIPRSKTRAAMTPANRAISKEPTKRLYIRLPDSSNQELLLSLKQTLDLHKGSTEVVLVMGPQNDKQVIRLPMRVDMNDTLLEGLGELVEASNIKLH